MGQCMYTRDTVDGVKDKVEDGLLVVASHFVFFLLRLRRTIETGTFFMIVIVMTMFQILCMSQCLCLSPEGDCCLLEWWREETEFGSWMCRRQDIGKYVVDLM